MRGGSIPLLAWGTVLLVLAIGNLAWNDKALNAATAFFAAFVIYLAAVAVRVRSGRSAIQTGPPEAPEQPEVVPEGSTGPVIFALGLASVLFGFTFSSFLIYFGAGLIVIGLGRVAVELRSERVTWRRALEERRR